MPIAVFRTALPVSPSDLFAWHERPGAFERLTPPWDRVRILKREASPGIQDGAVVTLEVMVGPVPTRWVIRHEGYEPGAQFRDVQLSGPFARWVHTHRMLRGPSADASVLEDAIDYTLPLGPLGAIGGGAFTAATLARLFRYRHAVTANDLARHARFAGQRPLRIAVTGATGLIGSQLVPYLTTAGHTVHRVVRRDPAPGDIRWDPARGTIDAAALEGVDAVIHLAGENVGERWTEERKRAIAESRVNGTALLARTLAVLTRKPRVLVSMSAIGIYGDRGDELLTEESALGDDFLAETGKRWEAAADPARDAGIRVVHPRLGVVLSARGGALGRMLLPFQLGAGGKLGSGRQWMSWIALDDVLGAMEHFLFTESLRGPVNLVAPSAARNADFTRSLGTVLHRPTLAAVPAFALRLAFGEMADATLLASQRVVPERLSASGFDFRWPTLAEALRFELGR